MKYLYHAALELDLDSVSSKGLQPSEASGEAGELAEWSLGKVFFSDTLRRARKWASHISRRHFEDFGTQAEPVIFRVMRSKVAVVPDPTIVGDWYTSASVSPNLLEIQTADGWRPFT